MDKPAAAAFSTEAFVQGLRADGYADEILERAVRAGTALDTHTHAWDSRLLVLQGSLTVSFDGRSCTCVPGETFEIARLIPHAEVYHPEIETRLLIGRRHR